MNKDPKPTVSRRRMLAGAASTIAATVLAACSGSSGGQQASPAASSTPTAEPSPSAPSPSPADTGSASGDTRGSATTPLEPPAHYQQAPALAAQVKSGKLPDVADRLPKNPYVIPHRWVEQGNYGGVMKIDITSTTGSDLGEWFCDAAPLRFLNDGQDVGPGLFDRWQTNADASVWTLYLRKGMRWSDGHLVTTADIMFWWNDMANYDAYTAQGVSDTFKSATGKIATFTAVDDHTLEIRYSTPTPLTDLSLASGTYAWHDGRFIVPAHFVKKYHPRYNKSVPKNWASVGGLWEQKCDPFRNPACPTLWPFMLTRYRDGRTLTFTRNPYCYDVTKDGDQLPYLDGLVMTQVADPQVTKLQISTGKVDYSHGPFNSIVLSDVSTLKANADRYGFEVLFWDSGSGTGSSFFFNQDYYVEKYRKLFRTPKFLQALSLAFDRPHARTSIYFNTGEMTTGTMSPKSGEFTAKGGNKVYQSWRDAYVEYSPAKAKKMLDELGLKDTNGDGFREFPDGSKLQVRIDVQADRNDETKAKDNLLASNWKDVGINCMVNPVPPDGFDTEWQGGRYMGHSNWEISDGPSIVTGPWWVIPIEPARWAPLQGQMYLAKGTPAYTSERDVNPWKRKPPRIMPEKGGPVEKLWKLYAKARIEADAVKRNRLVWQMIKIHIDSGPFFIGPIANFPQSIVKNKDLQNVPTRDNLALNGYVNTWAHPAPAVYDPECYYWNSPAEHQD